MEGDQQVSRELCFAVSTALEPGSCRLEVGGTGRKRFVRRRGDHLVVFVLRGGLEVDVGATKLELQAGAAFVGEAADPTTIEPRADSDYYLVRFRRRKGDAPSTLNGESPSVCVVQRPDRLTFLLRRYLMLSNGDRRYPQMCGLLVLILRELALSRSVLDGDRHEPKVAATIASQIDAYIAGHFREQIGTPDIAAEMHYNPEYLERAYRRQRHLSIRDAIHLRRLREAGAQLLLHRERCVSEIAAMCGYRDANYFRRVFKRTMNMTPNRFRHAHPSPKRDGSRTRVVDVSA